MQMCTVYVPLNWMSSICVEPANSLLHWHGPWPLECDGPESTTSCGQQVKQGRRWATRILSDHSEMNKCNGGTTLSDHRETWFPMFSFFHSQKNTRTNALEGQAVAHYLGPTLKFDMASLWTATRSPVQPSNTLSFAQLHSSHDSIDLRLKGCCQLSLRPIKPICLSARNSYFTMALGP